jgi:predicted small secreted protein
MKNPSKKTALFLLAALSAAALASGCRTVRGFGRDVERAGESIEESAR